MAALTSVTPLTGRQTEITRLSIVGEFDVGQTLSLVRHQVETALILSDPPPGSGTRWRASVPANLESGLYDLQLKQGSMVLAELEDAFVVVPERPTYPYSDSYEDILARMLNRLPEGYDKREGQTWHTILSPIALEIAESKLLMRNSVDLTSLENATGAYLRFKALEYGLTPLPATKAFGDIELKAAESFSLTTGDIQVQTREIQNVARKFYTLDENVVSKHIIEFDEGVRYVLRDEGILSIRIEGFGTDTGYRDGTHENVTIEQAGSNNDARATVVVTPANGVFSITITNAGSGYTANQRVILRHPDIGSGGGTDMQAFIVGEVRGNTYTDVVVNQGSPLVDTGARATVEVDNLGVPTGYLTTVGTTIAEGEITLSGTNFPDETSQSVGEIRVPEEPYRAVVKFIANEAGVDGNLFLGSIESVVGQSNISIASSTAMVGGADEEEDEDLRARVFRAVLSFPRAGNIADYERWAREASDYVGKVNVEPVWRGGGTVRILFLLRDDTVPSSELIKRIQDYIFPLTDDLRSTGTGVAPVGAFAEVFAPDTVQIHVKTDVNILPDIDAEAQVVIDNVKQEILNYINGLDIGEDVRITRLFSRLIRNVTGVWDISDYGISVSEITSTTAISSLPTRIEIAENQKAVCILENITVEEEM